jgi:hypothetical protein
MPGPGGVDALPGPLTSGSVLLDGQGRHLLQVLRSEQGLFGPFKEPAFVVPSPGPLSFDPVGHANVPGGILEQLPDDLFEAVDGCRAHGSCRFTGVSLAG